MMQSPTVKLTNERNALITLTSTKQKSHFFIMTFFRLPTVFFTCIQLFRERLSEKMCTRQSRKKIWDMINTRFLTTVAVKHTFAAFL